MGKVQIMWKEIAIGFIVLYLIRNILDIYLVKKYKNLIGMYGEISETTLKRRAKRHLKLCDFFAVGPWNKQIYLVYNGLCLLLASISLIEENECEFLSYLDKIKKEREFEMKAFVLSLYYSSKNDIEHVEYYYNMYLQSEHIDNDIAIIMDYLFNENKNNKNVVMMETAVQRFNNPAIIKLLKDNGVL